MRRGRPSARLGRGLRRRASGEGGRIQRVCWVFGPAESASITDPQHCGYDAAVSHQASSVAIQLSKCSEPERLTSPPLPQRITNDGTGRDLKRLTEAVRVARKRLQRAIERARQNKIATRHGHADRLADLRQLLRRSDTIRRQCELLQKGRRTVHEAATAQQVVGRSAPRFSAYRRPVKVKSERRLKELT